MPELPEVEVITQGLRPHLVGRAIISVSHSEKKLRFPVPIQVMQEQLLKKRIVSVSRRAKYILISLEDFTLLIIHLGMTGNMGIFPMGSEPMRHDHVHWGLDNNMVLRYNDTRRFGSIHIFSRDASSDIEETFFARTGPEPFDPACNKHYLLKQSKGTKQPVKTFLMNGEIIAGVGNIYANETLFKAGIHPSHPAGDLTEHEWAYLLTCLRETLNWAIKCGGSTISDFLNASGEKGYFQANFQVYGKEACPCAICSSHIEKIQLGGRASFFCPLCQKR